MFYKEWEEVEEVKITETKFTSQQNFAPKMTVNSNNLQIADSAS